jgi:hypothetical protein
VSPENPNPDTIMKTLIKTQPRLVVELCAHLLFAVGIQVLVHYVS